MRISWSPEGSRAEGRAGGSREDTAKFHRLRSLISDRLEIQLHTTIYWFFIVLNDSAMGTSRCYLRPRAFVLSSVCESVRL